MSSFIELGVPRDIADALSAHAVSTPFPIQEATIPAAMGKHDVCGQVPTGSGKTLAFAIPLAALGRRGRPRRPGALVLVPTRELAAQVADVLRPLAAVRRLTVATFYGGTGIARDQRNLRNGVDIAIACPGRLADLVRRGDADLGAVRTVVLDEADRMADMGFLPDVRWLLDQTPEDRQTLLFSATLDGDVDVLIRRYQRHPVRSEPATPAGATGDVRHFFWHASANERVGIAEEIVSAVAPAIVFTRTKHAADRVAKQLNRRGVRAAAIHGNRSQGQRERALADFSNGRVSALVATDVAARGIHVDRVGVVVHYDPPATGKDYLHRSGRTGRAGADGLVVTLVPPDRVSDVTTLQRALSMRQRIEKSSLEHLTQAGPVQGATTRRKPAPSAGFEDKARRRRPAAARGRMRGRGRAAR